MAKKKVFQISNALTEGLEETITAAHHYAGELRVDVIPIKRIEVDPDNPRELMLTFEDVHKGLDQADKTYDQKARELAELQTIANSIREQGIINPILVYKYGERYRLIAGERRTLASILAGKTDIQAKILDSKPNELKISLLQWIENVERTDLSLWERVRNLEKIIQTYSGRKNVSPQAVTITELSNLIGCTKPHAMNYKSVLMADDDIKHLIKENKIKNLEKAAFIAGATLPTTKQLLVENCLAGATLKKLKLIAEQTNDVKHKKVSRLPSTRGRQASSVNFGVTKNIKVAKVVVESLFKSDALKSLTDQMHAGDLNDYKSVTETFKQLIRKLEKLYI